MILEITEKGWYIGDENEKFLLNSKQVRELIEELKNSPFSRAYSSRENTSNLVIEFDDKRLIIKNYYEIKNMPYINELNSKINKHLLHILTLNIKNRLKKNSVKITVLTSTAIVLFGGIKLYKSMEFKDIENKVPIVMTDQEEFVDISDSKFTTVPAVSEISTITSVSEISTTTSVGTTMSQEEMIIECFNHYCDIFEVNEEDKEKLLQDNINSFKNEDNIEQAIIDFLYKYYMEYLYLQRPIYYNNYSEEEQEATIMKYAKIHGVEDKDIIATMLAIHQWESAYGTSEICYYNNNLGGNRIEDPYTGVYGYQIYPNVEIGAIDFVDDFLYVMNCSLENENYNPNDSIEVNMNREGNENDAIYGEDPNWSNGVGELKQKILEPGYLEGLEKVLEDMNKEKGKIYWFFVK